MRKHTSYPKQEARARFTFYAIHGARRVLIQGATMEAVQLRLKALCPDGNFRELWEGCAEPIYPMMECEATGVRQ